MHLPGRRGQWEHHREPGDSNDSLGWCGRPKEADAEDVEPGAADGKVEVLRGPGEGEGQSSERKTGELAKGELDFVDEPGWAAGCLA